MTPRARSRTGPGPSGTPHRGVPPGRPGRIRCSLDTGTEAGVMRSCTGVLIGHLLFATLCLFPGPRQGHDRRLRGRHLRAVGAALRPGRAGGPVGTADVLEASLVRYEPDSEGTFTTYGGDYAPAEFTPLIRLRLRVRDTGGDARAEGAAPTGEFELTDEWPVPPLCLSAVTAGRLAVLVDPRAPDAPAEPDPRTMARGRSSGNASPPGRPRTPPPAPLRHPLAPHDPPRLPRPLRPHLRPRPPRPPPPPARGTRHGALDLERTPAPSVGPSADGATGTERGEHGCLVCHGCVARARREDHP